ncbi:hypothetical protein GGTG_11530 [Gaeumannomyces tritici R3-111a-1]|uniref:Uncharacterized protein n=1 Tax=Gaeumannomyces tritici (strain R3-111a-1) TaxID=644352 RepID=J3PDF9_GAET3|nr:hypothetical protein GGTG_11530 [Gaeumannomyces tritici R3-111a-1]EJT70507.1 hypothetical protein GGTG_11530 [Gaeumannomyces tritici R3-111a-1]
MLYNASALYFKMNYSRCRNDSVLEKGKYKGFNKETVKPLLQKVLELQARASPQEPMGLKPQGPVTYD